MHLPGQFLLTSKDDFTSHGSMFKATTSQLLGFTLHGSNSQALLPFYQIISVALHGPIIYYANVYDPNQVEHIPLLPKKNIPPDI